PVLQLAGGSQRLLVSFSADSSPQPREEGRGCREHALTDRLRDAFERWRAGEDVFEQEEGVSVRVVRERLDLVLAAFDPTRRDAEETVVQPRGAGSVEAESTEGDDAHERVARVLHDSDAGE